MKIQQALAVLLSALCLTVPVSCSDSDVNRNDANVNSTEGETTVAVKTESTVIETPASEFEYSENEDGTITIKKYNGSATDVVVPQTVTTITDIVFDGCESLQKVYFEGNAPEHYIYGYTMPFHVYYTVYHHENATGFTTPKWNGYPTEIW